MSRVYDADIPLETMVATSILILEGEDTKSYEENISLPTEDKALSPPDIIKKGIDFCFKRIL